MAAGEGPYKSRKKRMTQKPKTKIQKTIIESRLILSGGKKKKRGIDLKNKNEK